MELDIKIDKDSLSISIDDPFHLDLDSLESKIGDFVSSKGDSIRNMDIRGLLPRMVRGIAGCENGCPADAKRLVSQGFEKFEISYIEGGILSARAVTEKGKNLSLKMFPDF